MIKNKKIIAALMAGAMIFTGAGCNLIEKTEGAINRQVVAKGKDIKIKRGDVDADPSVDLAIKQLEKDYGKNFMEDETAVNSLLGHKKSIAANLANRKIMDMKLKELKIELSKEEIDKKVDEELKKSIETNGGQEEFDKLLAQNNVTVEDLKLELEYKVKTEAVEAEVTKDVTVSDEAVKKEYDDNQEKYTEEPNQVKVSYMLVDTQEKADDVIKRLDNNENFADIAKEMSLDTSSKENGGDLGYITYNDYRLGREVLIALKILEVGKYQYINDARGYNIIKVEDKKEFPVKKFEDVKDEIKSNLEASAKYKLWSETTNKWYEEVNLKFYDEKMLN